MEKGKNPITIIPLGNSADADTDPEVLGAENAGRVINSQNMRPTGISGHVQTHQKIKGETVFYPNVWNVCAAVNDSPFTNGNPVPVTYQCIGTKQVLNHLIEFWADSANVYFPFIRIDGWVVCYPPTLGAFPLSTAHPLQIDSNDSCVGGELMCTDDNIPPFIFNVEDMLTNAGVVNGVQTCANATTKYFAQFNIGQYAIQPSVSLDHPVFIEIMTAGTTPNPVGNVVQQVKGGGGGMNVGMYQYAIQWVDSSGNVTNWSELTPQIPVPEKLNYYPNGQEQYYPGSKVEGAGSGTVSTLGVHIRFRVNNFLNYSSINVRRLSWNTGQPAGSLPNPDEIINLIPIIPQQVSIIDFYDNDNGSESVTPPASIPSNALATINSAKAIRYYNSRLVLMNITYQSRDIGNQVTFISPTTDAAYPFVRPLGFMGYHDIWNNVYRKKYFGGERYGFSVVLFDGEFNAVFAIPVPGNSSYNNTNFPNDDYPAAQNFNNFQMPNRRTALKGASLNSSAEINNNNNFTKAVNSDGTVTPTFEIFDTVGAISKSYNDSIPMNQPNQKNVSSGAAGSPPKVAGLNADYQPIRPVGDNDTTGCNFDFNPTVAVGDGNISDNTIDGLINHSSNSVNNTYLSGSGGLVYQPKGFQYNMYALGMILQGIASMPSWVAAFTVMRTEAANRIVAQGQAFYNLHGYQRKQTEGAGSYNQIYSLKDLVSVFWDSPDFYSGFAPLNEILNNVSTGRYNFQLASPLGLFSEVWQGISTVWSSALAQWSNWDTNGNQSQITAGGGGQGNYDMISYCRILRDQNNGITNDFNPSIATGVYSNMSGIYHDSNYSYTGFDSWRNHSNGVTSNAKFTINGLSNSGTFGNSPRQQCWTINLTSDLYNNSSCDGWNFNDNGSAGTYSVRDWHEPLYAGNIIDDTRQVATGNIQTYFQTGVWVKTNAIIGQGTGTAQVITLVDERWQDCIPDLAPNFPMANQGRFIWVQTGGNQAQAWLNVTYLPAGLVTTIISDITTNGFYVWTDKCHGTINVYGIYTHRIIPYQITPFIQSASENTYTINFDQQFANGNPICPPASSIAIPVNIIVRYDNCSPIEVFGGDAFVGEYNYPIADGNTDFNGNIVGTNLLCVAPLPYRVWDINENINILLTAQTGSTLTRIQNWNTVRSSYITGQGNQQHPQIREYLINGIVESRVNTALEFGYRFPNVNYILQPYSWSHAPDLYSQYDTSILLGNGYSNISGAYDTTNFIANGSIYGGWVLDQLDFNNDYQEYPTDNTQTSKPIVGFNEQLNFCSRVIWSSQRSPAQVNSPNLLNFPTLNYFDIDDRTGAINFAWDNFDNKYASNLYAFTQHGRALLPTNQLSLSETSAAQLAVIGDSEATFIQQEIWQDRSVGMPDEMWRSVSEFQNTIWWADYRSVYRFRGTVTEDISEGYTSVLRPLLDSIQPGFQTAVTSVWDNKYKEYRLNISKSRVVVPSNVSNLVLSFTIQYNLIDYFGSGWVSCNSLNTSLVTEFFLINNTGGYLQVYTDPSVPSYSINMPNGYMYHFYWNGFLWAWDLNFTNLSNEVVWSEDVNEGKGGFISTYKYYFDRYVSDIKDTVYGARAAALWQLDSGYTMNGANIMAYFIQCCSPKEMYNMSKEFVRIRINANNIPDTVNYYQSLEDLNSGNIFAQMNTITTAFALKNYGMGWTNKVPRGQNIPYLRNQGRYTIFQVSYGQAADWYVSSTEFEYRKLIYP